MQNRFALSKADARLMGVCSGLANMTGQDALLFRLGFVLALCLTGPVALVIYVAAGLLAPTA